MSLVAHVWALDKAPVKHPTAVLVLVALADESGDDGTGACPYVKKIMARARTSERSVQKHLRELYRQRLIDFGDAAIAMQRYHRGAYHAPRVWNLNYAASWDNVPEPRTDEEMLTYSDRIGQRPVRRGGADGAPGGGARRAPGGVQTGAPGGVQTGAPGGVQTGAPGGVQTGAPGGVQTGAPFPLVPADYPNPPPTPEPPNPAADAGGQAATEGGDDLDEKSREMLNAAVDRSVAARHSPDWSVAKVRTAVRAQLDARVPLAEVVGALTAATADQEGTAYPGRLAWWVVERRRRASGAAVPATSGEGDRYRHAPLVPPGAPRCYRHPEQPAGDDCPLCLGEKRAEPLTDDEKRAARAEEIRKGLATKGQPKNRIDGTDPLKVDRSAPFAATMARLEDELAKLRASVPAETPEMAA